MKISFSRIARFVLCQIAVLGVYVEEAHGKHPLEKERHGPEAESHTKVRTLDIEAVEGRTVSLPCPLSAPLDDVNMVLWFRDNAGIPLYSFDYRSKSLSHVRHWSAPEVFGSRAMFNVKSSPASLDIKDIKRHDQGVYRCRIDFRTSQTQSFRHNLSVIILPEHPIVLDRWGRQLNGTILGPKQEGDDIMISCRVVGGRPQPEVRWLVNGLLVDDQYEQNSGDVIENRLMWPAIQRTDLNSVFTCQATNTLLAEPKESSYVLDIYLKPLEVKIKEPPGPLVADRRYEITCQSSGSRPNAIITWYKGKRQLRRTRDDVLNNTTLSELSFVPSTEDDGKSITCRAENPNVNGLFLETSLKLNVVYPPMVNLRLGSTLSADDIKEGDDVYFECHVQANPPWRKLLWLHDGVYLAHNTTARVIRSNQSLVLQKVTRFSAGNYACSAINQEGETVSNQLPLRVKYTPICATEKIVVVGAGKDENVEIVCDIHADPPARTFRWKFNNSGETLDVGSGRYTSQNGTRSILHYTPVTDQDFGTLSCWGISEIGSQAHPCMFQVVLAGFPSAVSNCTLYNQTQVSTEIQCIAGYDGGLPQVFVLELYSQRTGRTRLNFTNSEEPYFILDSLETLSSLMTAENETLAARVFAVNQKGRSQGAAVPKLQIGNRVKQTEHQNPLQMSPVLIGAVITVIVICVAIILRICYVVCVRSRRTPKTSQPPSSGANFVFSGGGGGAKLEKGGGSQKPRWQHTDVKSKASSTMDTSAGTIMSEDEKDPDVIPQYVADHPHNQYHHHQQTFEQPTQGWTQQSVNVLKSETLMNGDCRAAQVPSGATGDLDINITAIRDRLMTTRVPESCV
ncbi:hemicentin-2 isoform X1 [Lutzomyia longipalpis]|uniref:hemicentin-2 isoform X1 n=1 Tax=Lutzomyia longipalpis TaxID=7200 RepID=UPI00248360A6|nr:hemicentin-2 isoform X1 [Lutzomyia longipalpis]XP_055684289.1 hemicentin-2 isoform X1 [Lutzomyia longipalpis]XP_055684290.1 hemicentin-2 isoform X1 [Lutzomyia longipalpis]